MSALCSPLELAAAGVRLSVALMLLVAAVLKVRRPPAWDEMLADAGVDSRGAAVAVSVAVPASEAAVALWLLSGAFAAWALGVTAAMLVLFSAVLMWLRWRGYAGNCGCFGETSSAGGDTLTYIRNSTLAIGLVGAAVVSVPGGCTTTTAPLWHVDGGVVVVAVTAVVLTVLFGHAAGMLATNRRRPVPDPLGARRS
jgi:hypothetical protein